MSLPVGFVIPSNGGGGDDDDDDGHELDQLKDPNHHHHHQYEHNPRGGGGGGASFFLSLVRSLVQRAWFVLLVCVVSAAIIATMLVVLLVSFNPVASATLENATFVLTTYHSLQDIVVYKKGENSTMSSFRLLGTSARVAELRCMHLRDDSLLVVQSLSSSGAILRLPYACQGGSGLHVWNSDRVLQHPYGVTSNASVVFVSNQNGDNVVFFNASSSQYLGTLMSVVSPRDLLWYQSRLYINSVGENLLIEVDPTSGARLRTMAVTRPIAMMMLPRAMSKTLLEGNDLLLVGSNAAPSVVLWIDVKRWTIVHRMTHQRLSHPAGMTWWQPSNALLVFSQDQRIILSWDVSNATWKSSLGQVWVSSTPFGPEGMVTVQC